MDQTRSANGVTLLQAYAFNRGIFPEDKGVERRPTQSRPGTEFAGLWKSNPNRLRCGLIRRHLNWRRREDRAGEGLLGLFRWRGFWHAEPSARYFILSEPQPFQREGTFITLCTAATYRRSSSVNNPHFCQFGSGNTAIFEHRFRSNPHSFRKRSQWSDDSVSRRQQLPIKHCELLANSVADLRDDILDLLFSRHHVFP